MSVQAPPATDKDMALQALRRMPDDASWQQIAEELAILAAIRRGEAAVDAGRVVPHDEVKQRSVAWTTK